MLFLIPVLAYAGKEDVVTDSFKVKGLCERCKARIEDAASIRGVKYADWNVYTNMLIVKYDTTKTSPKVILTAIAHAGHDNEMATATEDEYGRLPDCCRYRSMQKKH